VTQPGDPQHYRYLNRGGRWKDFHRVGLERRDDGALELQSLPRLAGTLPPGVTQRAAPEGVAGVLALPGGLVLFTDPPTHHLLEVDPCDQSRRPVACLSGPGNGLEDLREPRGLAWHRARDVVLVADSGNDRIVLLDRSGLRTVELWTGLGGARSVACDPAGDVYVVTAVDATLVKLDALGRRDARFADRLAADPPLHPAEVAVAGKHVVVLGTDGHLVVLDLDGGREDVWDSGLTTPMGLAAASDTVYVGDQDARRLVDYSLAGVRRGEAAGYAGPVAAVALDRDAVLVHPGGADGPLRLQRTGAFGTRGVLWGGPFATPDDTSAPRHLVRAAVSPAEGCHLQLVVCEQAAGAPAPPVDPEAADPFADARWRRLAVAPDAVEMLFTGAPLDEVWIGMTVTGGGSASPVVHQIRIDFAYTTYLQYLPALYQRDPAAAELLARWLTVFDSGSRHVQAGIDDLVALFSPGAAPPSWLAWLAGWLALELPDSWDAARRRAGIAGAFAATAQRGTVAGLRDALRERVGVEAVVEEPILQTSWWALAADDASDAEAQLSVLGSGTMLARAEPQGAVLGTSAVLDGSFLTPQAEYAQALFDDVAHQFTVRLYRGSTHSEDAVSAARAVLDAERPAHTAYHLCVVEPRLRVGVQARLGIDAIVAGDPEPTLLVDTGATGLVLDGPPPGRLGTSTRVGQTYLIDG
jgi:phage tail-like protein